MQFSIKKIKIKISFTFFALILLFISLNKSQNILPALLCSFLHECGHFAVLLFSNEEVCEFHIGMFGANIIKKENLKTDFKKEFLINIAGPVVNLIIALLFLIFNNKKYVYINLIIAFFNLLPIYSLDGGKALSSILNMYFDENKSTAIITIVSYFISVPLIIFSFVLLLTNKGNIQLFILSVYILLTLIFKK